MSTPHPSDLKALAPTDSLTQLEGELLEHGFAARLRDDTKAVHREAERTGFMADLLRGRATRSGYGLFLRNLVPVYEVLESGLASLRRIPLVAAFGGEDIRRLPRLLEDVAALAGPEWKRDCPLLPEAQAYAQAIQSVANGDGARLAAHAYARYLGDLSGGQILKPFLARTLDLTESELRFYDFSEVGDVNIAKVRMRRELDTIRIGSAAADAIVDEAIKAFRFNIELSVAVSRLAGS